jgi:[ribosomal protein S5]-alanine N-acetyltransferase
MTATFRPTLRTDRLVLRPLEPDDATGLLAIFSDAEVMKYWNTPPWTSPDDARDFIATSAEATERGESMTLGMVAEATGELIGKCLLFSVHHGSRRAELGFGLGRPHWGQGFVAEAGRALLDYAFDTLRLRRIEAEIDPRNVASAKTLERLGFVREGLLRQRWEIAGELSDSALYGLLADDRARG